MDRLAEGELMAVDSIEMEPQMNADERRLNDLSEEIIGAAFEVSNVLGAGFLEKVYENALNVELNFSKPKVEIKRIVNGV